VRRERQRVREEPLKHALLEPQAVSDAPGRVSFRRARGSRRHAEIEDLRRVVDATRRARARRRATAADSGSVRWPPDGGRMHRYRLHSAWHADVATAGGVVTVIATLPGRVPRAVYGGDRLGSDRHRRIGASGARAQSRKTSGKGPVITSSPHRPERPARPVPRRSAPPRDDLQVRIGQRLRRLRLERGLSLTQLARPHYTRAQVSAVELGKILPSLTALRFFARQLDVPLRDLIPDDA
jgi:DNA-binding XRE family transcriptional regulator